MVGSVGVEIVLVKLTNPGVFVNEPFSVLEDDVPHRAKLHDLDLVDAVETRRHVGSDGSVVDFRHISVEIDGCHCSFSSSYSFGVGENSVVEGL